MWIFLPDSFLSIVDKGDDTGQTLLVRGRRKGDIEQIFPNATVQSNVGTDYAVSGIKQDNPVRHTDE